MSTQNHPCFNLAAKGSCGRVHLPVAPKCNVLCNFCNRKFDCLNESRPGVASAVLSPSQAVRYLEQVLEREPRTTVAGIAGPGDPMANAVQTLQTMRLARERFPELLFCLATNGLALPRYVDQVVAAGVSHVTVTVNAVDPNIGRHVYKWVRDEKVLYTGLEAGKLMLSRQIQSIVALKERGIAVKVNTIVIPGINETHVQDIAEVMGGLGVDLMNCIPLHPTAGTPFGGLPEPAPEQITSLRLRAGEHVRQMTHCQRCRADAVGLLDEDRSREFASCLSASASAPRPVEEEKPFVAVATREGMLVNQHLGEAKRLQVWKMETSTPVLIEERQAPTPGCGPKRWEQLARDFGDCRAIVASAAGETPQKVLADNGIEVAVCSGSIRDVVCAVYEGSVHAFQARQQRSCGSGCGGDGMAC